jgi:hypothetical protein
MDVDPRDAGLLEELDDAYGNDWAGVVTFQDAVNFVNSVLDDATDEEYEFVRSAYMGLPPPLPAQRPRRAQAGGDDIDIYKLLQLADAIHDFDPPVPRQGVEVIPAAKMHAAIQAEDAEFVPDGLDFDKIRDIPYFLDYLRDGPFDGIDIMKRFDLEGAFSDAEGDFAVAFDAEGSNIYTPIVGVTYCEVWMPEDNTQDVEMKPWVGKSARKRFREKGPIRKRVVYLAQIARVCKRIRTHFGEGKLTFIMDNSDEQFARLIFATSRIDPALAREFVVIDPSGEAVSPDKKAEPVFNWTYAVCDANLLDGVNHFRGAKYDYPDPAFSAEQTGMVFDDDCPVTVELQGIHGDTKDPTVKYSVTYKGLTTYSSPKHSMGPFSAAKMSAVMSASIARGDDDILQPLSQKRACDWGQVEHCLEHGTEENKYVFVTTDRLAIAYGIYRDANVISMKRTKHGVPNVLQCTFMMHSTGPEGPEGPQEGGASGRGVAFGAALCAVVVACALLQ